MLDWVDGHYNIHMTTQNKPLILGDFTPQQVAEFVAWALARKISFRSMPEFLGAMDQYFSESVV